MDRAVVRTGTAAVRTGQAESAVVIGGQHRLDVLQRRPAAAALWVSQWVLTAVVVSSQDHRQSPPRQTTHDADAVLRSHAATTQPEVTQVAYASTPLMSASRCLTSVGNILSLCNFFWSVSGTSQVGCRIISQHLPVHNWACDHHCTTNTADWLIIKFYWSIY